MEIKLNKNKLKRNILIVLILIIGIIGAILLINSNNKVIKKDKLNLSDQKLNLDSVTLTPADENVGNYAHVSSATIISRKTGTAPWDINNDPGNDNNDSNNIVRSFDRVEWTVNCDLVPDEGHESESYTGGVMYIKAYLPENIAKNIEWDLSSMPWAENATISSDNTTFTAYYTLSSSKNNVPGNQEIVYSINVLGVPNNTIINPQFTIGFAGNDESKLYTFNLDNYANEDDVNSTIKVSATPRFNVLIGRNTATNLRGNYDFQTGQKISTVTDTSKYGRMQGFGITLQLYNPDYINENGETKPAKEKGLKGVAIPVGEITFDLILDEFNDNGTQKLTFEEDYMPTLWDYIENNKDYNHLGKQGRVMDFNSYGTWSYSANTAPYNKRPKSDPNIGNKSAHCYDGGIWNIVQDTVNENVFHVSVNNYIINGKFFPVRYAYTLSNSVNFNANVGCFSSMYTQVLMQMPEDIASNSSLRIQAKIDNVRFNTVEYDETNNNLREIETTSEINSSDSTVNAKIEKVGIDKNSYSKANFFHHLNATSLSNGDQNALSRMLDGKAIVALGESFYMSNQIYSYPDNQSVEKNANILQKFDDKAIELVDGSVKILNANKAERINVLYGAKPDKKGWGWNGETQVNSDIQMVQAKEENLIYFTNYQELQQAGYTCVAVLLEYRNIKYDYPGKTYRAGIKVRIKDDAQIGQTYQVVNDTRVWTEDINNFSWGNINLENATIDEANNTVNYGDINYPQNSVNNYTTKYNKTLYNADMVVTRASSTYTIGNTIYVAGAKLTVQKEVIDRENDEEKVNYNIAKNEFEVNYKITPKLENNLTNNNISGVNIKITDTLPEGLTYITGSSEGSSEPYIINNDDGTQTLIWYKFNQTVNQPIQPITYKAKIFEESENNQKYTTTTVVEEYLGEGDTSKIANSFVQDRTTSKTINIVNLAGSGYYIETDTPVIERNGQIKYNIVLTNVNANDLSNFYVTDVLPHNGDSRGSYFNGTCKLAKIDIVQKENGTENIIPNSNLSLYISDEYGNNFETAQFGGNINREVGSFYINGDWVRDSRVEITVTLNTNDNMPEDTYFNSFKTYEVGSIEGYKESNIVKSDVVKREISGFAWLDRNENGLYDEDEGYISDIKVSLLNTDETTAKDIYGNDIEPVYTDYNGYYKFEDMQKGEYFVKFEYLGKESVTDSTQRLVGVNTEINSKIYDEGTTGVITELNSVASPVLSVDFVNAGYVMQKRNLTVHHYFYDETKQGEQKKTTIKVKDDETREVFIEDYYETEPLSDENLPIQYEIVWDEWPANSSETMGEDDVVVTYYYKYNKYPYTIRYVDKDDPDNVLYEDRGEELYNTTIPVTDKSQEPGHEDEFWGYSIDSKDKESIVIGTNGEQNVATVYYTKNKHTLTIHHYFYDETKEGDQKKTTTRIANDNTQQINMGDQYTAEPLSGGNLPEQFEFVSEEWPTNTSDVMRENDVEVTFYYRYKTYQYNIKYVDKDNPDSVLYEIDDSALYGSTILVKNMPEGAENQFYGYSYDSKNKDNIIIGTNEEQNVATVYYTKNKHTLTVHHYFYDETKEGDQKKTTRKIANDNTQEIYVGDYYSVEPLSGGNLPEQFEFVSEEWPTNTSDVMRENDVEVIFYYRYNTYQYSIKYVDKDNPDNVLYEINESALYGSTILVKNMPEGGENSLFGYLYKSKDKDNIIIGTNEEQNVATVLYEREKHLLTVHHYFYDETKEGAQKKTTTKIANDTTQEICVGDYYSAEPLSGENLPEQYEFVSEEWPTNTDEMMGHNDVEVIFYYRYKTYQYKIKYVDKDDPDNVLYEINESALYGSTILVKNVPEGAGDLLDGYVYSSKDKDNIIIGTNEEQNIATVLYEREKHLLTVHHYFYDVTKEGDERKTTTKIANDTTQEICVGDYYSAEPLSGENLPEQYEFVSEEWPTNTSDVMRGNDVEVTFYYKYKTYQYSIKYVDKDNPDYILKEDTGETLYGTNIDVTDKKQEDPDTFRLYQYDSQDKEKIVIGTNNELNTATVYYTKIKNKVTTHYYLYDLTKEGDERKTTTKVADDNIQRIYIDDSYEALPLSEENIPVYCELVESLLPQNAQDTMGENDVEVIYYYSYKQYPYTIRYVELNNETNVIKEETGNAYYDSRIEVKDKSSIEPNTFRGYTYENKDKDEIVIRTEGNTATVYYLRAKKNLIVHFYFYDDTKQGEEKKTTAKVAEDYTKEYYIGQNYTTSIDLAQDLPSYYELVDELIPQNAQGPMGENDVEVIYYLRYKSYPYTIKYVEKDNEDNVIKTENGRAPYRSRVEILDRSLDDPQTFYGYSYDSKDKDEIVIDTQGNMATVYYTRMKKHITVHYYFYDDTKQGEQKKTTIEVAEGYTEEYFVGQNYRANPANEEDLEEYYELVEELMPTNAQGPMGENNIDIIYYYRYKSYPYTIKYVEKDNESNVIKEENGTAPYGSTVEVKDKAIDDPNSFIGYAYDSKNKNEIVIGTGRNTATVYYTRINGLAYTVKYIDYDTREELKTQKLVDNKRFGDRVRAEDERIDSEFPDHYYMGASKDELSIGINTAENVMELYYRKKGNIIVKYVDQDTGEELSRLTSSGRIGDTYQAEAKEIEGYTLVERPREERVEYKVQPNPQELVYYYKKQTKVIVKHIDRANNNVLKTVTKDGLVGDKYTSSSENFEGYALVESPDSETVTMTRETITLRYYYAKVSKGVIEKHINIYSNEIIHNEIHEGNVGDEYNIKPKSFEDYELCEDRLPNNANDVMTEELIEVIYYYKHKTYVLVRYLDNDGNDLAQERKITGYDGDKYNAEPKEINGYRLMEEKLPTNSKGTMEKNPIIVRYYYEKIEVPPDDPEEPDDPGINNNINNETKPDNTTSDRILPYTGRKLLIIAIITTLVILSYALIRTIKYKDIK